MPEVKALIHFCWVAGITVWSHMASDTFSCTMEYFH